MVVKDSTLRICADFKMMKMFPLPTPDEVFLTGIVHKVDLAQVYKKMEAAEGS